MAWLIIGILNGVAALSCFVVAGYKAIFDGWDYSGLLIFVGLWDTAMAIGCILESI